MYKDVETWVRQNNDEYKEPASFEFEKNTVDAFKNIPPELGEHIRKELFYFKPDLTFIAHGSYGGVPKPILNYYQDCQRHIEEQPVQFFYDELYPHVIKSLRECAYSVGAKPNQITFVPNVEFGMNAILRSIDFKQGERVLMFDITYGAVKMTVDYISKSSGVVLELMSLRFPIKDSKDILDQFEDYLSKNTNVDGKGKIRLAAFEHITSPTAIVFPVKEMIQICHKYDIMVMIDGAHAWGQVKLNLQELDPDFYVTNGHKWLCNVRGAALMYVKEELQTMIHPPVLSWGLNQGFHSEFIWMGTMDYCPMISARIALKFFEWLGIDKVHKYNTELIEWATNMLTAVWNSETLVPLQMCQYMAIVHIPDSKEACSGEDSCQMSNLHDQLLKEHQIEVPIFTFKGKRWARISAHVYNTKHDFIRFAQAVITTQKLGEEAQEKLNKYKLISDQDPSNK